MAGDLSLGFAAPAPTRRPRGTGQVALAWALVGQRLRTGTAGSVLGLAWAVVQPLAVLAAYSFLLGVLRARTFGPGGDMAQIAYLMAGLVPWLFLARSASATCTSLSRYAGLVRSVNLPLGALPLASVGEQVIELTIGLTIALVLVAIGGLVGWHLALVPPLVLALVILAVSLAYLLGPLSVMLRDLPRIVAITMRFGFFVTPVLYLPSRLGDAALVAELNPLAYFVSAIRFALTGLEAAHVRSLEVDLAVVGASTAMVALLARLAYHRLRRQALDHL